MNRLMTKVMVALLLLMSSMSHAEYALEIQKVSDNVYAIVGELSQRNPENLANNATFGVVVTDEGVLLVDPGGTYQGAAQLDRAIRTITDKSVKIVINSGGQDHRWLGNSYFKERGAHIIASEAAVADHRARTSTYFNMLDQLVGDKLEGTREYYADETFTDKKLLKFGGLDFELVYAGPAHTVGDIFVWMPSQRIVFSGDIVYTERLLGPGPAQDTGSWVEVFEAMMSYEPVHIIPGHGHLATPAQARADTYDYLTFLRGEIAKVIEEGGDIYAAVEIDQSRFSHLKVFDLIARRNAQGVFAQMEFE